MPGTPRHDRAGTGLGGVVGLAKIHEGYWLRPPPSPFPIPAVAISEIIYGNQSKKFEGPGQLATVEQRENCNEAILTELLSGCASAPASLLRTWDGI